MRRPGKRDSMRRSFSFAPALILALLLAAAPASAGNWPSVPLPDNAQGELVSSHMVHNNVPMRVSRFQTTLTPAQVIGFYQRHWKGQAKVTEFGDRQIIAYQQGGHFITLDVRGGSSGSEVQLGITELLDREPGNPPGHGFPQPDRSQVISDTRYQDSPGRTIALESPQSAYQAWEWYRARLQQQGWKDDGEHRCSVMAMQCQAGYQRGNEVLSMTFNRTAQHTEIVANQMRR